MSETSPHPVYRITDLHVNDRPRERLASLGPQVRTNAELLAILLRAGVPGENAVQGGQRLHRAPFHLLCKIPCQIFVQGFLFLRV